MTTTKTNAKRNKTFLCIEHGERFLLKAKTLHEAEDEASHWGAEVIDECALVQMRKDGRCSVILKNLNKCIILA